MTPPDGYTEAAPQRSAIDAVDGGVSATALSSGVSCDPSLAREVEALARRRGVTPARIAAAIFLLVGPNPIEADPGPGPARLDIQPPPDGNEGSVRRALWMALALADGDVPLRDARRLELRVESLEYRNKALRGALDRLAFPTPTDGSGRMDVREAAMLFGFPGERCFDESMVRRRFRELAPVYHPDTGLVGCRKRMAALIEARDVLVRSLRVSLGGDRRRA